MTFNVTEIFEIPIGVGSITVENLLYFAVIIIVGVAVAKTVSTNVRRALVERLPKNEREVLVKLVYYIIVTGALIIALPQLQFDLSGLLVAAGIVGLVVGFATERRLKPGLGPLPHVRAPHQDRRQHQRQVSAAASDIRISTVVRRTTAYSLIPNRRFTSNIANYVHNAARRFST